MKLIHLLVVIVSVAYFISGCSFGKNRKDGEIPSDQEMMATGDAQFKAGQYQDAMNTYQSLIINHPISDLHIETQLKIADTYGKMEDYESQMEALHTTLRENIIPEKVPQIYVQIAKFYEQAAAFNPGTVTSDTMDYKTAIEYYTKAYQYKDSDETTAKAEAMYRRALTEARMGKLKDAVAHYKLVESLYPESSYAPLANIKFQNPSDLTELSASPDSLEGYLINQYSPTPDAGESAPPPPKSFKMNDSKDTAVPVSEERQTDNQPETPEIDPNTQDNTVDDYNTLFDSGEFEPAASDTSGI